jgi:hypothetical protein
MSRNIAILGLVQILLVVLGFFGLVIVMKLNGYPDEVVGIRWNSLALSLRRHGMFLLLLPAIWTICTALSQNRRFLDTSDVWLVLGILFAMIIISLFFYACVNPYQRLFLMRHYR